MASSYDVRALPNTQDFFEMMAGPLLGSGLYRDVYSLPYLNDYVLKVEVKRHCFHNVREWDVWQQVQFAPDWSRWLAPCVVISPDGKFLLQRRTMPVLEKDLPAKLPEFLTDRKVGNFGRLDKHIVCHDYALIVSQLPLRLTKGGYWTE
jgi:hypothetical protein